MRKIAFLCLLYAASVYGMDSEPKEPIQHETELAIGWAQLPTEIKQYILKFVSDPASYKDLVSLLSTSKIISNLITDELFIKEFAQRAHDFAPARAIKLFKGAIEHGNIELAKALVMAGELVGQEADDDLLIATNNEDQPLVEKLLEAGADPNIETEQGLTPLKIAIRRENKEIAELLIMYGADINNAAGKETPLMTAIAKNNRDLVTFLLENKADVNYETPEHQLTALMTAAQKGNKDMVDLLLAQNAHVNAQNAAGNTPLIVAATNGFVDIVNTLLEHGADSRLENKENETALIAAKIMLAHLSDPVYQEIINLLEQKT